jgi:hypothetical protein
MRHGTRPFKVSPLLSDSNPFVLQLIPRYYFWRLVINPTEKKYREAESGFEASMQTWHINAVCITSWARLWYRRNISCGRRIIQKRSGPSIGNTPQTGGFWWLLSRRGVREPKTADKVSGQRFPPRISPGLW